VPGRRIPDKETLVSGSRSGKPTQRGEGDDQWLFTVERARQKLARSTLLSPQTAMEAAA